MILANYAQENRNQYRLVGITFTNPMTVFKPTVIHRKVDTDDSNVSMQRAGNPHGYNNEYSWNHPIKAGAIASTLQILGIGSIDADALAVKLATADLTGSGELIAIGSLIVQALAAISGSGGITAANLQAFLQAVANISGSGEISDAALTGLGTLIADLDGSGTAAASVLTAIGELAADIVVTGTGLSTANVASAVWGALATANNISGTMGEKLNGAASAGDPWGTALPGAYAPGTAGDIVGNLIQDMMDEPIETGYTLREITRLVSAILLGKTSGGGTTTETFRDINDTKDRVVATVDSNGNRTNIIIDES